MKIKTVYIDTSVISHLAHHDVPEKMQDTWRLWEEIKNGRLIACVSAVTAEEIDRCPEPKRTLITELLVTLFPVSLEDTEAITALAEKYVELGVLSNKHMNDCLHIAAATVYGCDYIVSWNFKHFVDDKIIERVHSVNGLCGYCKPQIVSPTKLLEKECKL